MIHNLSPKQPIKLYYLNVYIVVTIVRFHVVQQMSGSLVPTSTTLPNCADVIRDVILLDEYMLGRRRQVSVSSSTTILSGTWAEITLILRGVKIVRIY